MATAAQPGRSTPAPPAPLGDLGREGGQAITDVRDRLIAETFALSVKRKNVHGHRFGPPRMRLGRSCRRPRG